MTTVYTYHLKKSWLKPTVIEDADVRHNKQTWVFIDGVQRHLLGSSAFYTEAALHRSRKSALLKIVTQLQNFVYRNGLWWHVVRILYNEYDTMVENKNNKIYVYSRKSKI